MTRLTTRYNATNPITNIERAFEDLFNFAPIFHNLEDVYRTGDQVRFANREKSLIIQIDIPGCKKDDLDIDVDHDARDVYIKGKRTVMKNDGEETQTMNRSFSIGREFDLNKVEFKYEYGVLEVKVPRRKKEEYIKKYTV